MRLESISDMRIEVVKREINQGALAGFDSTITDQAALLIIAALDSFDQQALEDAWRRGFRQGIALQKARSQGRPHGVTEGADDDQ
jgi:hypothetical protein